MGLCTQHVGVGPVAHFASALVGSVPRCLCTVVLGGDIEAAVAAPDINKVRAELLLTHYNHGPVLVGLLVWDVHRSDCTQCCTCM